MPEFRTPMPRFGAACLPGCCDMPRGDERTCPQCGGTGQIQIKRDVYVRCSMCGGSGTVRT